MALRNQPCLNITVIKKAFLKPAVALIILLTSFHIVQAQVRISGSVYDITKYRPLEAVSVLTNSGNGTVSDSLGHYSIIVNTNDSIWFSYLNRPTPKYAIRTIPNQQNFEISLHVTSTDLKEVKVMSRNYRLDSIANREEYAKAFNFHKPGIGSSLSVGPNGGAGLDLDEFINMFKFRRNRRMLAFQNRLVLEEEQAYVDHRFNRVIIIKLTQLRGPQLDSFIETYRPSLQFVEDSTDYELQEYIKKAFRQYQNYVNLRNELEGK
ncbi:MAG: hypothetical protein ABI415_03460 [Flavitalea sp.]